MTPILDLFETHLTVADLDRSMKFYGEVLGLELASFFQTQKVAFYWMGGRGNSMLGLWETGSAPQRLSLHIAFRVGLSDLLQAPEQLRAAGIAPLDFAGQPSGEPIVLAWMPAAAIYFRDPDGNMLEYLCMLPDIPRPDQGVLPWSAWERSKSLHPPEPSPEW